MSGIIDYSLANAHKDFNALPFSKVDGLIFAQLAYLDYDTFVPEKQLFARGITFSKIVLYKTNTVPDVVANPHVITASNSLLENLSK